MKRSFKYISIAATNVAQPAVGTTTTAAVPISAYPNQLIAVVDSSVFEQGQWGIIDVPIAAAGIPVAGAGVGEERFLVESIPDGTHIRISIKGDGGNQGFGPCGCQIAHVSGVYIRAARLIANVYIQSQDGNANPLFISETPLGTTAGVRVIAKLQNVPAGQQPTDFKDSFTSDSGPNPMDIGEFWVVGTVGDKYLPSYGVV